MNHLLLRSRSARYLAFLLTIFSGHALLAQQEQPNIIFILFDDLGYGDLGVFYQNGRLETDPKMATPFMDSLASEGMILTDHYSGAPVCAGARSSLLTGMNQGNVPLRDTQFDSALPDNHNLATVLKEAGYATWAIGKWGLQGATSPNNLYQAHPFNRGFDQFFGYLSHYQAHYHYPKEDALVYSLTNQWRTMEFHDGLAEISDDLDKCYTTDLYTAKVKQLIGEHSQNSPGTPFFAYLAYDAPHAEFEAPTQAYPPGGGLSGGIQWIGTPGNMINTASGTIDSYIYPEYDSQSWNDTEKRFASMIRRLDECIIDIIQLLEDLNLDDDTIIVITSDNGPTKSGIHEANFFDSFAFMDGTKGDLWEGGIRVPTIVWGPGYVAPGQVTSEPSDFSDWLPTFAQLSGVLPPANITGVSILPTLTGVGTQFPKNYLYFEYTNKFSNLTTPDYPEFEPAKRDRIRNQMQAIRIGDFKGVRYNVLSQATDFEIYDVVNDPKESINLASRFPSLQAQMKEQVLRARIPYVHAARPYDEAPVPAYELDQFSQGVEWKFYEGDFHWVPDTQYLTAAASGQSYTPDLSIRTREDNYAIEFSGYLLVETTGEYTFSLQTDTGAVLKIHDAIVLDADFNYSANATVNGSLQLAAGLHPYKLTYYHKTSISPNLVLSWIIPGSSLEPIPANNYITSGVSVPKAFDDVVYTDGSSSLTINPLANDFDDGTPAALTMTSISSPIIGSADIQNNLVEYTPMAGKVGVDTFTYTISDGENEATATIRVEIYSQNDDLWIPADQSTGLEVLEAGGRPVGSLIGYASGVSPWVSGKFQNAISFDGMNDHLDINNFDPPVGSEARTITAWIFATTDGITASPICGWGETNNSEKWNLNVRDSGSGVNTLRLEVSSGFVAGSTHLTDGQWHHVACVFPEDASPAVSDVVLYVDGQLESTTAFLEREVNTSGIYPIRIGGDFQGRFFSGAIDDFRLYRRALSPQEITDIYNIQNPSGRAWAKRYFASESIDWTADNEGDSLNTLMEYAFGRQPSVFDTSPFSTKVSGNGKLSVSFPRRSNGTHELSYTVQFSNDLIDWQTFQSVETESITDSKDSTLKKVTTEAVKTVTEGAKFVRIQLDFPIDSE